MNSDRLLELLAILSQKKKGLQDVEEEIALDELDADLTWTMEYQYQVNLWRA